MKRKPQGRGAAGRPGGGRRPEQVAGQIAELISSLLLREVRDPRVGMVAITKVRMTPDLRVARISISTLGEAAERDAALAGLRSAASFLRRRLGEEMELRHVPELTFAHDVELQDARRVDSLLRGLRERGGGTE